MSPFSVCARRHRQVGPAESSFDFSSRAQAIHAESMLPNPAPRWFLAPCALTPAQFPSPIAAAVASPSARGRRPGWATFRLPSAPPPAPINAGPSWMQRARAPLPLLPHAHSPAPIPLPPSSHRANAENNAATPSPPKPPLLCQNPEHHAAILRVPAHEAPPRRHELN